MEKKLIYFNAYFVHKINDLELSLPPSYRIGEQSLVNSAEPIICIQVWDLMFVVF